MPLIPRRPFRDLEEFFQDEWPKGFLSGSSAIKGLREPRMDIYEEDDNLVAEVELPGVDADNVEVNVTENALKIKARQEKKEEKEEKGYYKKELSRGYFRRAVRLPVKVKDEQAEANYEDGVLTITMPKSEQEQKEQKGTQVEIE